MKRSKFSEEQVAYALRQAEAGTPVVDVPLVGAAHGAGILNWIRQPLQSLLILWAWWYTDDRPRDAMAVLA